MIVFLDGKEYTAARQRMRAKKLVEAARAPAQSPPPQPPPPAPSQGAGKAAAIGVTVGAAVGAIPAVAVPTSGALTAVAVAGVIKDTLYAIGRFLLKRRRYVAARLLGDLQAQHPEQPIDVLKRIIREEIGREEEFQRKMLERLRRDLPTALAIDDPAKRAEAVKAILDRERRYTAMREEAMIERASHAIEMVEIQERSPQGAYWALSVRVKEHTLDCLALGNRFWPWEVLKEIHPPLHPGCKCYLLSLDDAVKYGFMRRDQVPDPKTAAREARRLYAEAKKMEEAGITGAEFETFIEEAYNPYEHRDWHGRWASDPYEFADDVGSFYMGQRPTPDQRSALSAYTGSSEYHQINGALRAGKGHPLVAVLDSLMRPTPHGVTVDRKLDAEAEFPGLAVGKEYAEKGYTSTRLGLYTPEGGAGELVGGRGRDRLRLAVPEGTPGYYNGPGSEDEMILGRGLRIRIDKIADVFGGGRDIDAHVVGLQEGAYREHEHPRGRNGKWINKGQILRRAAREIGDLKPPALSKHGTIRSIEGRPVFVPHGRRFDRSFGGNHYVSPIGTTDVYRNGKLLPRGVEPVKYPSVRMDLPVLPGHADQVAGVVKALRTPNKPKRVPRREARSVTLRKASPDTFSDYADETVAISHTLASHFKTETIIGSVNQGDLPDHAGFTDWDGNITVGEDVSDSIRRDVRLRAKGTTTKSYTDLRNVFGSYKVQAHESAHTVNPENVAEFEGPGGQLLEEALAEEIGQVLATENLRRHGRTDVLQWYRSNPDDAKVIGSYTAFRAALGGLLDRLRVPPEDREQVLLGLKFNAKPKDRVDTLVALGEKYGGKLTRRQVLAQLAKGRVTNPDYIPPILAKHIQDVPVHRTEALAPNGDTIGQGSIVQFKARKPIFGVIGPTLEKRGRVVKVHPLRGETYSLWIQDDDGEVHYGIVPEDVTATLAPPAPVLFLDQGVAFREGTSVTYRNYQDIERKGIITQVLTAGDVDAEHPQWAAEVTLADGHPVIITPGSIKTLKREGGPEVTPVAEDPLAPAAAPPLPDLRTMRGSEPGTADAATANRDVIQLANGHKVTLEYGEDDNYVVWPNGDRVPAQEWVSSLTDDEVAQYIAPEDFNKDFWAGIGKGRQGDTLYHGTHAEKIPGIMADGLEPRNESRGFTNQEVGPAVFTSSNAGVPSSWYADEETPIVAIDVAAMKRDGFMPEVTREPPLDREDRRAALSYDLGIDDYEYDTLVQADGLDPDTVIFYDKIPAKYLHLEPQGEMDPGTAKPRTVREIAKAGRAERRAAGRADPGDTGLASETIASRLADQEYEDQRAALAKNPMLGPQPDVVEREARSYRDKRLPYIEKFIAQNRITDPKVTAAIEDAEQVNASNGLYAAFKGHFGSPPVVAMDDKVMRGGGLRFADDYGHGTIIVTAPATQAHPLDGPWKPLSAPIGPGHAGAVDLPSAIRHEYGHYVYARLSMEQQDALTDPFIKLDREQISKDLSKYAGFHEGVFGMPMLDEVFAEAFATVTDPRYKREDYAPWVQKVGDDLLDLLPKGMGDPGTDDRYGKWTHYHGTTKEAAQEMARDGLKPLGRGSVFMASSVHGNAAAQNDEAILRVSSKARNPYKITMAKADVIEGTNADVWVTRKIATSQGWPYKGALDVWERLRDEGHDMVEVKWDDEDWLVALEPDAVHIHKENRRKPPVDPHPWFTKAQAEPSPMFAELALIEMGLPAPRVEIPDTLAGAPGLLAALPKVLTEARSMWPKLADPYTGLIEVLAISKAPPARREVRAVERMFRRPSVVMATASRSMAMGGAATLYINDLTPEAVEMQETVSKGLAFGSQTAEGRVWHEVGHMVQGIHEVTMSAVERIMGEHDMTAEWLAANVSAYATASVGEAFAEVFSDLWTPGVRERLPAPTRARLEDFWADISGRYPDLKPVSR